MMEATTATTQTKTAKHTGPRFGLPIDEIPKIDLAKMEMPAAFRELTAKGVAEARDTYEKAKAATEKATDQLKDAYTTAAKGATDYNLKVIEIAGINTSTAFDNARELLGAQSPSEFVALSSVHMRKQLEAMTAQTKELAEIAQKVATEIAANDWRLGNSKASNKVA
jgi:phasin